MRSCNITKQFSLQKKNSKWQPCWIEIHNFKYVQQFGKLWSFSFELWGETSKPSFLHINHTIYYTFGVIENTKRKNKTSGFCKRKRWIVGFGMNVNQPVFKNQSYQDRGGSERHIDMITFCA